MAVISFHQNRLGRTDGVSLEVDKWRAVLEGRMGHEVWYCSGNDDVPGNHVIPELYAHHPETWAILRNGTVRFDPQEIGSEAELEQRIYDLSDVIADKLLRFIDEKGVQLLIPNNLCSGGYQPAAAIAFHKVFRSTGLPGIIHSHDFYFEDSGEVDATCQSVASIYERYFPAKLPNIQHVFINRIAQGQLKQRKNIDGTVVPNVFDFDQDPWVADDYNADFREQCGLGRDDLVFLQATRILDRKGIELAIDAVAALETPQRRKALDGAPTAAGGRFSAADSKIILLCAGIVETIGISGDYWGSLQAKATEMGVDLRHVGERVKHSRGTTETGEKVYSLWDSYVFADFVTYPSQWEGWGNQFIEAVFARLPVLIFEYPVWCSDLAQTGFDVVSLGHETTGTDARGLVTIDQARIDAAADAICTILTDPTRKQAIGEHNYAVGKRHYSVDALAGMIADLLARAGIG